MGNHKEIKSSTPLYKLALVMIMRDEEHCIRQTLESVYKYIDYYIISDTGSKPEDKSKRIVKEFFEEKGIPGEIHDRPWVNFGVNRTEVLRFAKEKAKYAFMMDADDLIHGELILPESMDADGYWLMFDRSIAYERIQIFKTSTPWYYGGPLHEFATIDSPVILEKLEGEYWVESRRKGSRNKDPRKYLFDAVVFHGELEKDPKETRNVFYLAQSYFDAKDYKSAKVVYFRRTQMGGWPEEVYFSWVKYAMCCMFLNDPYDVITKSMLNAQKANPSRPEAHYEVSRMSKQLGRLREAYEYAKLGQNLKIKDEFLFRITYIFEYGIKEELAQAAYSLKYYKESYNISKELVEYFEKNIKIKEQNIKNLEEKFEKELKSYQDELAQNPTPSRKDILLSYIEELNTNEHMKREKADKETYEKELPIVKQIEEKSLACLDRDCSLPLLVFHLGLKNVFDNEYSLYGPELGVLLLMRELKDKYRIVCFDELSVDQGEAEDGIVRFSVSMFDIFQTNNKIDILVCLDTVYPFLNQRINCENVYIWCRGHKIPTAYPVRVNDNTILNNIFKNEGKGIVNVCNYKIKKFVCMSEWQKAKIRKTFEFLEEEKFEIIEHGCLGSKGKTFDFSGKQRGKFAWFSHPDKGLAFTINTFHKIHKEFPECELHIYRGHEQFENDKELIKKNKVFPYIKYHRYLPNDKLMKELETTDIWLFPTFNKEPFSVACLEAQDSGCICITTPLGGRTETIGDRGILLENKELNEKMEKEILEKVRYVMEMPEQEKNEMRKNAMIYARKFNWFKQSRKWIELFNE